MLTRIVSFYFANVPQSVVSAQAAVFRKFGQPIEQIRTTLDHGPAIDQYIRHSKFDVLLIFDVDCIPLNEHVVPEAIDIVANRPCLYGLRQNSNSFAGGDYVGPSFICFSRETFNALGRPSFRSVRRKADVGSQLTYRARRPGLLQSLLHRPPIEVRFLDVTDVAVAKWRLEDGTPFGTGTNYEDKIFHAFGVGNDLVGRRLFLGKAAQIVGHSDWVPAPAGTDSLPAVAPVPGVAVYVISLPDAEGRRRTISARLNAAGVPFRFVDAIDGRVRPVPDQIDGARVVREAFATAHALARTASHRLVHRMIAEGDDDMALVLEDDARPSDNFAQALAGAAKFDFDVLKFEGGDHDSRRTAVGHMAGFTVVVRRVPSLGSAAYLIRRSAAARFCSLLVVDQSIGAAFNDFRLWLRVLELEPFAVMQDGEKQHYAWIGGPRPRRLEKLARSIRIPNRLVRLYGFRVALALELQRFRRSFDRG